MRLHIGSPRELPFVFLTLSWLAMMELTHQFYLVEPTQSINYVTLIILVFTLYNYLTTCFKEPGIIPNSNLTQQQALASIQDIIKFEGMNMEEQEDQIIAETSRTSRRTLGAPVTERSASGASDQSMKDLNYKYCESCMQIKPPTAEHCTRCYGCIKKHFAHSAIAANCIGERNSRNYFWTVAGMNLLGLIYVYKGTMEILKGWDQYLTIPKQYVNSYEIKSLTCLLIIALFFKFMISRRYLKIRWVLNGLIVSLIILITVCFQVRLVLNEKTGFVWAFVILSYLISPFLIKSLWSITFVAFTGKTRKQLQVCGLKPQQKIPAKMARNFYQFLFGDIASQ